MIERKLIRRIVSLAPIFSPFTIHHSLFTFSTARSHFTFHISHFTFLIAFALCLALPLSASATDKLVVEDGSGNTKFSVTSDGSVSIGSASTIYPLYITSDIATAVPGGVGMQMLTGNSNKERFELRSAGVWQAPTVQGKGFGGTIASPSATQKDQYLMNIGGSGHDGNSIVIGNKAGIFMMADENWTTSAQGTYIRFEATQKGTTSRTEKMRLTSDGNLGIGTNTPSALLDVNSNGIRIRTAKTPASASAACNQGDMSWDANYVYVCVANNSWKRAALASW